MAIDPDMPTPVPIFRAPMRARDRDVAARAGAEHGVRAGLVGTGDALIVPPASLGAALAATEAAYGQKAARMLERFAELPNGTLVWTQLPGSRFALGQITGPWRYDDSAAADAVGIHQVRAAAWVARPFGMADVPVAVAETFMRGGRNLQRIHSDRAERQSAALWRAFGR